MSGVQRPLPVIEMKSGSFIGRGMRLDPLYRKDRWQFTPKAKVGDVVNGGAIIGIVMETETFEHRIMVPPDLSGTLSWVAPSGEYTIEDPIAGLRDWRQRKRVDHVATLASAPVASL